MGKASGIFLLLRVLFVVPEGDPLWGPHAEAGGRVLRIGPCTGRRCWEFQRLYSPLFEYDLLAKRFHRRSPDEIEALEIR